MKTVPNHAVYSATKFAVSAFTEGLRQESGDTLVTLGFVRTDFVEASGDTDLRNSLVERQDGHGAAVGRSRHRVAMEQPAEIDVGEIVVHPTAQS